MYTQFEELQFVYFLGIIQALLQNPNVSDSVYEELICSYGDPCQIPQALIQVTF